MKRIFTVLVSSLLLYSCTNEASFDGIWLGTAREMDKEVYVPMPRIMVAKTNGFFDSYIIDNKDTNSTTWQIKDGSLLIDTSKFHPSKYEITKEQFTFKGPFNAYYQRIDNETKQINIKQFKKYILNYSWESEYDIIHFYEGNKLTVFDKRHSRFENLCWNFTNAEGFSFLIKKGDQTSCNSFYRFPELINSFKSNQFSIKRWEKDAWKEVVYKKFDGGLENIDSTNFQTCNPYLYRGNPSHRYYYKGTFYQGGFYKINKLFDDYYKKPLNSNESGLIKVEFIVNCQGVPGRFSMMQFDEDYKIQEFSAVISSQIFEFTKTLTDWNAGKNKEGESIDTFRFLTFRIKNGEVVEIFP